jgi:hypothetical protein
MRQDDDVQAVLGPARLAYFTPTGELSPLSERKAVFLLAASGLIATVLFFFLPRLAALVVGQSRFVALAVLLILPSLVTLVLAAAWFSYRAMRTGIPDMPSSAAYFQHVVRTSFEEYERHVKGLTHRDALRAILNYNYSVARQAVLKFRRVELSLRFMRAAILLWIILLLIVAIAE